MSRLRERYIKAVEDHTDKTGRCDLAKVLVDVKPTLSAEERERYVDRGMLADAKGAATRGKAEMKLAASAKTLEMFPELHRGYAIDGDETYIKSTDDMSELEFMRVIEIRQNQVTHDTAHIGQLERAYAAAKPIWVKHPAFTFGQCCKVLKKQAGRRRAA